MPIIQRSFYDAAEKGRQDRANAQINLLRRQAAQQDIQQQNVLSGLMSDPNTTPEQFARAGRSDIANSLHNLQPDQAAQAKEFATQMVNAARYGLQSPTPKAFIERNFPFLAQTYGPEWATATDDDVKRGLQDAAAKFGVQAGIAPQAPKPPGTLYKYIDENGNPVFGEAENAIGKKPYEAPRKGIKFTGPDGTEIEIGGDGAPNYDAQDFGKSTRNNLEKAFVDAQGNSYALREQLGKYRDEFSTLGGKFKAGVAAAKDMAGMDMAPQQQQYLSNFSSWKADTARLLSQYLNQLSGAAISPTEEARLKSGFPNADDGPTVYRAKAESTMRNFALVQARAAYLLSKPGVKMDSISLEGMSNIIAMEANKLAKSLERGGMDAESAKQKAILDTRARFGLNQ